MDPIELLLLFIRLINACGGVRVDEDDGEAIGTIGTPTPRMLAHMYLMACTICKQEPITQQTEVTLGGSPVFTLMDRDDTTAWIAEHEMHTLEIIAEPNGFNLYVDAVYHSGSASFTETVELSAGINFKPDPQSLAGTLPLELVTAIKAKCPTPEHAEMLQWSKYSNCGDDCRRVAIHARRLVRSMSDATDAERSAVWAAVAHQCLVFSYS